MMLGIVVFWIKVRECEQDNAIANVDRMDSLIYYLERIEVMDDQLRCRYLISDVYAC